MTELPEFATCHPTAALDPDRRFIGMQTLVIVSGLIGNAIVMAYVGAVISHRMETRAQMLQEMRSQMLDVQSEIKIDIEELTGPRIALLERSWATVTNALQESREAWVVLDAKGIVQVWSDGAVALFGVSREAAVGFGVAHIIPADVRQKHLSGYGDIMGSEGPTIRRRVDCMGVHADGTEFPASVDAWATPGVSAIARVRQQEVVVE